MPSPYSKEQRAKKAEWETLLLGRQVRIINRQGFQTTGTVVEVLISGDGYFVTLMGGHPYMYDVKDIAKIYGDGEHPPPPESGDLCVNDFTCPVVQFLRGVGPNGEGYFLDQILGWSNDDWELDHSFIQWVFPTLSLSLYNPEAPVLTVEEIRIIRANPYIQDTLGLIYQRWLRFCGLRHEDTGLEFGTTEFPNGNPTVWGQFNHNWLRITRVLHSLGLLGRSDLAQEFFDFLSRHRAMFTEESWSYWSRAMKQ
jgi:hypothetical protein